MDIATFRQRFKDFSPLEQDFLKILAIVYEPINQTAMVNLMREADVRTSAGIFVHLPMVKSLRDTLAESDWAVIIPGGEMKIAPKYAELAMRMAVVDKRYKTFVRVIQRIFPHRQWFSYPRSLDACIREMRIALYDGDAKRYEEIENEAVKYFPAEWKKTQFLARFFTPFDADWMATFPPEVQVLAMTQLTDQANSELEPVDVYVRFLENTSWYVHKSKGDFAYNFLINNLIFKGKLEEAQALVRKEPTSPLSWSHLGMIEFFQGKPQAMRNSFETGFTLAKRTTGAKAPLMPEIPGVLHLLDVLREKRRDYLKIAHDYAYHAWVYRQQRSLRHLDGVVFHLENRLQESVACFTEQPVTAVEWVVFGATCYWCDRSIGIAGMERLRKLHLRAQSLGYEWLEMEFASLLSKFETDETAANEYAGLALALQEELKISTILDLLQPSEKWERSLDALLQLEFKGKGKGKSAADKPEKQTRLAWLLDFKNKQVQPVEQSYSKGAWSKGRNVAIKRVKDGDVPAMTEQDRAAAKAIKGSNQGFYGAVEYYYDFEKLYPALVGHPLLFLMENPAVPVELVSEEPQLLVEERRGDYEVKFSHDFQQAGVQLIKETPTRYIILKVSDLHLEVNRLLEFGRLRVPEKAKEKLVQAVGNLSSVVTVQSSLGGEAAQVETVGGDPTICVHLLPVGNGFKLEFFAKPFKTEPPYFKPGHGRDYVISTVQGKPMRAHRDLKKERENARRVEEACPTLQKLPSDNQEWLFDEVEDCLQVLLEIEPLRNDGEVHLEHPKGEKLRIAGHVSFDNLSLGIKKERDWFEVSGQVRLDEKRVMDFKQLLELSQNAKTRFVEIGDGEFVALTAQLRRKLEELNNLFSKTKKDLRLHPLAVPAMEDFTSLLHDLEVDAAWKKQIQRIREANQLQTKVPSTFKAELRNYQEEGFRWLSQLAYWGVGACLADDMGLGKTIQALALILDRAKAGPTLVVAPASVVRNWFHEALRFAPTLNPIVFGHPDPRTPNLPARNRKEVLDNLQPFDLLLCSYGLMQAENETLSEKHFTTVVLDEAQAIKNRQTKRSQAAMQLQGDFKIITTGTPIENHLGEVWNLFNFLNPGLLGSLDRFNEIYANPIEKYQDKERRNQLRRLLQPFILRRRKNDVLQELPEKTEITLSVELSAEERAFYEALRRRALENIESAGDFNQKRFQILAELMRLRQACCHPKMVTPESPLSSSKLGLFAETVEELLENGHKALVFSQFVKHLKIVEDWVKERGISYQYLDGSTPLPVRDKSIRAFQAGEGDLFLISLKAGGFGLNLTAADYVIHLDPWWNPAVEDQASDRAHRIGQKRPVTIYRLVAEDTIEDKIVKLHADKRELADSLLEGTEMSGAMSAEQLLALIKS